MKVMTEAQYKVERTRFPHGLILVHDRLMVDGLYNPDTRDDMPPELLEIDNTLLKIYNEINRFRSYCLDCTIVCSASKYCTAKLKRVELEKKAENLEATMKNMLIWYRMQTV